MQITETVTLDHAELSNIHCVILKPCHFLVGCYNNRIIVVETHLLRIYVLYRRIQRFTNQKTLKNRIMIEDVPLQQQQKRIIIILSSSSIYLSII
jgi:hypothetical protein